MIDGKVIALTDKDVVVNIGYKSEGVISRNEFRYNPHLKVGDTVVFGQYAGSNTIEVDGEELIIMGESEIYAVVE